MAVTKTSDTEMEIGILCLDSLNLTDPHRRADGEYSEGIFDFRRSVSDFFYCCAKH